MRQAINETVIQYPSLLSLPASTEADTKNKSTMSNVHKLVLLAHLPPFWVKCKNKLMEERTFRQFMSSFELVDEFFM